MSNVHVSSGVAPAEVAIDDKETDGEKGGGVKVEREFLDFGKRVRYHQPTAHVFFDRSNLLSSYKGFLFLCHKHYLLMIFSH